MYRKTDGMIGSREVFAIIKFMISLEVSDMTATILFDEGKTATWVIPLFSGIFILPSFLILSSLLKKFKDKGLIELVYSVGGKYFGFILSFILFLIMLFATMADSRNYVSIIQTMFLPNTPNIVIYILLISASCFIAFRGIETIGRTAWFLFPTITGVALLIILLSIKLINPTFLFPIMGPGFFPLVKASIVNSPIVADIFILTAIYPRVRNHKSFHVPILVGFFWSIAELMLYFAAFVAVFDYPTVSHILFPFQQLTMLIHIGRYAVNLEAFFFLFWVVASVMRYVIYLYLTASLLTNTLKVKKSKPMLVPLAALLIFIGIMPQNLVESLWVFRENFVLKGTWFVFASFPIVLLIISKIRSKKSDEKNPDQ